VACPAAWMPFNQGRGQAALPDPELIHLESKSYLSAYSVKFV